MRARCDHGSRVEVFADLASKSSIYCSQGRKRGGEPVSRVVEVGGIVFGALRIHYALQPTPLWRRSVAMKYVVLAKVVRGLMPGTAVA